MYSTQQNLFLQYWKRCKVTIKAVYLIAQWWYCCRQSKPNRSFRNKLAAGLCKARTSKFISLYRNPHSCTDLTQKYILAVCHYHLSYSAVQHGPFCGTATKLNIPVSEHFGKLQTPIGISSVRIRWNIPRLSFCRNQHWSNIKQLQTLVFQITLYRPERSFEHK